MAKKSKKTSKVVPAVDVKMQAAHDVPETVVATPEIKALAKAASPVQRGIHFNRLAQVKDKHQVISVFGKSGYAAYSWDKRAEILGITTEELCARFVADPAALKESWEKATKAVSK